MEPTKSKTLPLVMLDPTTIEADPSTYQFRSKGDKKNGETKTHRVMGDKWDALLMGDPFIVHEKLDGKKFVADGHHRLSFVKRLKAEGKEAPEKIPAYVLREADGYSAADVKIIAAYKNIQYGRDDVVDEARVLKQSRQPFIHQNLLPSLCMCKGNLKIAYTLSGLSDAALDKVASGDVPVESAVYVAEHVEAPRQDKVLRLVAEIKNQPYHTTTFNPFDHTALLLNPRANDNSFAEKIKSSRSAAHYAGR